MSYDPSTTAILLVDPYNDFLSEGGKLWPRVKAVAEEAKLLDHLREVVSTARARGLKIFFVPHHRWESGDYVAFDKPSPYQLAGATSTWDRAALPTPISIFSSSSTASVASS